MAFGVMVQNFPKESELIYMVDHEDLEIESKDESLITRKLGDRNYKVMRIEKYPTEQRVHLLEVECK